MPGRASTPYMTGILRTRLISSITGRKGVADGQKIQYTAYKLKDGTINIGRIHELKKHDR